MAALGLKPLWSQYTESKDSPTRSFFPFTTPSPKNHTPSIAERAKAFTASSGSMRVNEYSTKPVNDKASRVSRKDSAEKHSAMKDSSSQEASDSGNPIGTRESETDTALCPANIVATRRRLFSPGTKSKATRKKQPVVESLPRTGSPASDKENSAQKHENSANDWKAKKFNTVQSVVLRSVKKNYSFDDVTVDETIEDTKGELDGEKFIEDSMENLAQKDEYSSNGRKTKRFNTVESVVLRSVKKNYSFDDATVDKTIEDTKGELDGEKFVADNLFDDDDQFLEPKSLVEERTMLLQRNVRKASSMTEAEAQRNVDPKTDSFNIVAARTTWLQKKVLLNGTPFEDRLSIAPARQRLSDPPPPLKADSIFRTERWTPPQRHSLNVVPITESKPPAKMSSERIAVGTKPKTALHSQRKPLPKTSRKCIGDTKPKTAPLSENKALSRSSRNNVSEEKPKPAPVHVKKANPLSEQIGRPRIVASKKAAKNKKPKTLVESRAYWLQNQVRKNEFHEEVHSDAEEEEEVEKPKSAIQLRLEALEKGMAADQPQETPRGVAPRRSLAELP